MLMQLREKQQMNLGWRTEGMIGFQLLGPGEKDNSVTARCIQ